MNFEKPNIFGIRYSVKFNYSFQHWFISTQKLFHSAVSGRAAYIATCLSAQQASLSKLYYYTIALESPSVLTSQADQSQLIGHYHTFHSNWLGFAVDLHVSGASTWYYTICVTCRQSRKYYTIRDSPVTSLVDNREAKISLSGTVCYMQYRKQKYTTKVGR